MGSQGHVHGTVSTLRVRIARCGRPQEAILGVFILTLALLAVVAAPAAQAAGRAASSASPLRSVQTASRGDDSTTGVIAGIVSDTKGSLLPDMYLYAMRADRLDSGDTYTAADGSYRISGLSPSADYRMRIIDSPLIDKPWVYIWQWWEGASRWQDGTPIAVVAGETTQQNITMHKSAIISGKITTRLGLAVHDVVAEAYAREKGKWVDVSGMCCNTDGTFTIRQLHAGRYSIAFWSNDDDQAIRYYDATGFKSEAKIITLGDAEDVRIHDVVWGDTLEPTTVAPEAAQGRRGGKAAILYKVKDPRPHGPSADVTIQVRTLAGKVVKTVRLNRRSVNAWHTLYMRCDLRKGTYKFQVMAIDSGGNHQRKKAVNTLLVR